MTTEITHTMPDDYLREAYYEERSGAYETIDWEIDRGVPGEMCAKAQQLQSLLGKWDSIMNDPDIPAEDKAMFRAIFNGKMNGLEMKKEDGLLSTDEGFDDILKALESGDRDALDQVLLDTVDMDQLFDAFGLAYDAATKATNIKPSSDEDRLAKMYLTNDWDGLRRYRLEDKDDDKKA